MPQTDKSTYDLSQRSLRVIRAINDSPPTIRQSTLNRIQQLAEEFADIRRTTRDIIPKLVRMYRSRYAYHTIALEGNTLSQGETELVIEQGITIGGKSLQEHLEARNIPEALEVILDIAKTPRHPITIGDILDMHKLAMKGIDKSDPGSFRSGFVGINGTTFLPPPAFEISSLIEEMLSYINETDEKKSIEVAFKAHLWLVSIHPFYDGNGRVARLLMGLILLRGGYPPIIIRNEHRRRYRSTLKDAQLNSNFRPYYNFMTDEFISTLTAYILSAKQKSKRDVAIPLADAARSYGLDPEYLGLLARTGAIPAFKEGKLWFARQKDIEAYARKRERRRRMGHSHAGTSKSQ